MAATTYTAHGAHVLADHDRPGLWARLVSATARFEDWLERRRLYTTTVAQLSRLNDHTLADIGLERGDIRRVAETLANRART
jgi:uncharacterized protein YjiS (DUF1127 family)